MAQRTAGPHDPADALFVSRVFVVLAVGAFAYLVWQLTDVLLLVFGAVVVATILRSFARLIARRTRVPQRWSVPVAGVVILIGLVGVGLLLGTRLRSQLVELFALLPPALD